MGPSAAWAPLGPGSSPKSLGGRALTENLLRENPGAAPDALTANGYRRAPL